MNSTIEQRYLQKKFTRVRVESSDEEDNRATAGDDRDALAKELFDSDEEEVADEGDQVVIL